MMLYRSVPKVQGEDYSATYTLTVDGVLHKGSVVEGFRFKTSLNQDVIVGNNVINCYEMMYYCTGFESNIYFKGNTFREINCSRMLYGTNAQLRKNIFFNSILNNQFNGSNSMGVGDWTTMVNGFYNSANNVYCYYNYEG